MTIFHLQNFLQLNYLRRNDADGVAVGDLVVTSGEDGVFPEGVPLARVTQADVPETGLFLNIAMEPITELHRLEEVMVVLDPGSGPFHLPLPQELKGWEQDGARIAEEVAG